MGSCGSLYGLNDAARQFFHSVVEVLLALRCEQSRLDPALFICRKKGEVMGLLASHIDDFLHAGTEEFDKSVMNKLRERFLAGKLGEQSFSYVGFFIHQQSGGIILDQTEYVKGMEEVPISPQRNGEKQKPLNSKELTQLRRMVGKINWVVQGSRPDAAFDMVELSTKFKSAHVSDLLRAAKVTKKLKEGLSKVFFPNLGNPRNWRLVVYSDAALANLCDGVSSMGAHVVLLVGERNTCCPLSWHAAKVKRVVRSTLAAEALSLQEGLEDGMYLRRLIEELLGLPEKCIPLEGVVDNKSVVEAIHSTKMVDDKRLRLDICALKELLEMGEVDSVRWCPGEAQLANCMTKKGAAGFQLLSVLQSGQLT